MIQGNDVALFLSGQAVPLPQCKVVVSQPTIKQICVYGESNFLMVAQLFGKSDSFVKSIKQGNPELEMLSNFQIVMIIINQDQNTKINVENFFELIFPTYDVTINERDFVFSLKDEDEDGIVGIINDFNYEEFFKLIGDLFIFKSSSEKEIEYDPANSRANEIAEKLKKGREKVAKIKNKEKGNEDMSIFGNYASSLSIGLGMDINIFYNYTPFQLYDAFGRYWLKVSHDFYQKIASTPLMDVSKMKEPEEWSKNMYQ